MRKEKEFFICIRQSPFFVYIRVMPNTESCALPREDNVEKGRYE